MSWRRSCACLWATRAPWPAGCLPPRIALACGDHRAAGEHLQALPLEELTPRCVLARQILLAAAIERGDPMAAGAVAGVLQAARARGFVNTVVTTAPQVTSYLIEHAPQLQADPYTGQLIAAAWEVRAAQPEAFRPGHRLLEPVAGAELRVLKLLSASTYRQIAGTVYLSRNTVKAHLRSVYQKLGVTSCSQASSGPWTFACCEIAPLQGPEPLASGLQHAGCRHPKPGKRRNSPQQGEDTPGRPGAGSGTNGRGRESPGDPDRGGQR